MANLENLKKIDVALCWLEDLKPDDVVTIPDLAPKLSFLLSQIQRLGINKRSSRARKKFPEKCLTLDYTHTNRTSSFAGVTAIPGNVRDTIDGQICNALTAYQQALNNINKASADVHEASSERRLLICILHHLVVSRQGTAIRELVNQGTEHKQTEKREVAAARAVAKDLNWEPQWLTDVITRSHRYFDIAKECRSIGFLVCLGPDTKNFLEDRRLAQDDIVDFIDEWESRGQLKFSFEKDLEVIQRSIELVEQFGGEPKQLLDGGTRYAGCIRVTLARLVSDSVAIPNHLLPYATPDASRPGHPDSVPREASIRLSEQEPGQPMNGDVANTTVNEASAARSRGCNGSDWRAANAGNSIDAGPPHKRMRCTNESSQSLGDHGGENDFTLAPPLSEIDPTILDANATWDHSVDNWQHGGSDWDFLVNNWQNNNWDSLVDQWMNGS